MFSSRGCTGWAVQCASIVVRFTRQATNQSMVPIYLASCLAIYRVACDAADACARSRDTASSSPFFSFACSRRARAAKRLFWHLTARQIFTAPSPVCRTVNNRRGFSLPLYSQIGNLYFFRNDLFCRRRRLRRKIVPLIGFVKATSVSYKTALTPPQASLPYAIHTAGASDWGECAHVV